MPPSYETLREALRGEPLPLAFVDRDAFDRNLERVVATVAAAGPGLRVRVASKSVRSAALLRRLLERGGAALGGLLCYAAAEAEHLARVHGFDDLLVAYPVYQAVDAERLARLAAEGRDVKVAIDSDAGALRLAEAARRLGTVLPVVLCVDMSWRLAFGRVHVGVRRSPLHEVDEVVAAARRVAATPGLRFAGLLAYEAQVAGLGDANVHEPWLDPLKRLLRRGSARELGARRHAMVEALCAVGLPPGLVNGGGTGSLDSTVAATGVTEVAVGSAFYKPHLFDLYRAPYLRALEPACFFALEVTRAPGPGFVTCAGGGYVASGAVGRDKAPLPWLPAGLELLPAEMAGEVQTPLRRAGGPRSGASLPELGSPVVFRHAKAGELCERFVELCLLSEGRIVDRALTYRGEGQCFL
ncbi:MAG: alanine racemase [Polyangiaceae bacterium]|nr:alanine racemase [Polyangiaceae bacterium]